MHDDEKWQRLDKYKSKSEGERYVLFPFITLLLPLQKESNRSKNLGKKIKSLNYLVFILKIYYSKKC